MVGFEVSINGQRHCTAAIGDVGFIIAQVLWKGGADSLPVDGLMELRVGGVNIPKSEGLDWPMPTLALGDEVSIKIVKTERPDACNTRPMQISK